MSSSSDSDFRSNPPKRHNLSEKVIISLIEEDLSDSIDHSKSKKDIYYFSPSSTEPATPPPTNSRHRPNSSEEYIDNLPLSQRIQLKGQSGFSFFINSDSDSDFSGFDKNTGNKQTRRIQQPSSALVHGVTIVDVHQADSVVNSASINSSGLSENPLFVDSDVDSAFSGFESNTIVDVHQADSVAISASVVSQSVDYRALGEQFSSLKRLVTSITFSEETSISFLMKLKFIPPDNTPCPKCSKENRKGVLKYNKCNDGDRKCNLRLYCTGVGKRCNYKVSPFTGTFFDGVTCRLPVSTVIELIYCFIHSLSIHDAIRECEVNKNTVTDYYNYCRELCATSLAETTSVIGGPGHIVEIDESKFYTRKYNRGRILAKSEGWVFGGIDRSSKECFMVRVSDRSKETLIPIIQRYIKPGTTIVSDEWRAYSRLEEFGYTHKTICHKRNFVDPKDPSVHTQNIEISWRYAKATYPQRHTSEDLRESYLQEFLYRRKYKDTFREQFLHDIAKFYKHKDLQ